MAQQLCIPARGEIAEHDIKARQERLDYCLKHFPKVVELVKDLKLKSKDPLYLSLSGSSSRSFRVTSSTPNKMMTSMRREVVSLVKASKRAKKSRKERSGVERKKTINELTSPLYMEPELYSYLRNIFDFYVSNGYIRQEDFPSLYSNEYKGIITANRLNQLLRLALSLQTGMRHPSLSNIFSADQTFRTKLAKQIQQAKDSKSTDTHPFKSASQLEAEYMQGNKKLGNIQFNPEFFDNAHLQKLVHNSKRRDLRLVDDTDTSLGEDEINKEIQKSRERGLQVVRISEVSSENNAFANMIKNQEAAIKDMKTRLDEGQIPHMEPNQVAQSQGTNHRLPNLVGSGRQR